MGIERKEMDGERRRSWMNEAGLAERLGSGSITTRLDPSKSPEAGIAYAVMQSLPRSKSNQRTVGVQWALKFILAPIEPHS